MFSMDSLQETTFPICLHFLSIASFWIGIWGGSWRFLGRASWRSLIGNSEQEGFWGGECDLLNSDRDLRHSVTKCLMDKDNLMSSSKSYSKDVRFFNALVFSSWLFFNASKSIFKSSYSRSKIVDGAFLEGLDIPMPAWLSLISVVEG